VEDVLNFVRESGGLDYAAEKMQVYQNKAFGLLADFPDTASRQSMEQLVRFTTERKK
jgi:octaprenyl-diphosphate synthase